MPQGTLGKSTVYIRRAEYDGAGPVVRDLIGRSGVAFGGKKVLVKPNILSGSPPERGVTTHPSIVAAVVDALVDAGADVKVGDNPGMGGYGATLDAARKAGIAEAARGRFAVIGTASRRVAAKSRFFDGLVVSTAVLDADLVVNLPKFKTHSLTIYTGAVKNMFGMLVGAEKARIHGAGGSPAGFGEALADVFAVRPPDLSIIDGVTAMEGNGPNDGRTRHVGAVGMSTDPVALDATFIRIMGVDPAKVHHVRIAAERGFGRIDEGAIAIDGEVPAVAPFAMPASRAIDLFGDVVTTVFHAVAIPSLTDYARLRLDRKACTRCGTCVKACPTGAMKTDADNWPFIEKKTCIACYCCHELCEQRAWKMKGMMGFIQRRRA